MDRRQKKEWLFIDTSAFIALNDQNDTCHQAAIEFFTPTNILSLGVIPVTTNFVFAEVYAYFCRFHQIAIMIGESIRISKVLKYLRVEEKDEDLAWEIAKKYKDKDFSFTDCLSFAVMIRLGCQKAFAFDRHFRQMGFLVFP
ncbi:MAG TPA: VapC toxin family PIN domain ribonuclease [Desulfotomaculum sp.]|nr:VapC toxin family PIN domain ribonuclease [Desulfotomaculum sp.]